MLEAGLRIMVVLLDGEKTIRDVLKITGISKATFHRVVEKLIHDGIVLRRYDSTDYPPRAYYFLTEKGKTEARRKLRLFKPAIEEEMRRLNVFLEIMERLEGDSDAP